MLLGWEAVGVGLGTLEFEQRGLFRLGRGLWAAAGLVRGSVAGL